MAKELVTPLEDKQIEAFKAGASREEVATLSKQPLEDVPMMVDPLDPQQVTETTGLDINPEAFLDQPKDSDTIRRLAGSQILALNEVPTRELVHLVATDPNITGRLQAEYADKIDRRREELRDALNTTFVDSPADMQDNILGAVALDTKLTEQATQPGAIEKEVVDSVAPLFNFNEEKEDIQVLKLMQANSLAEMWNQATKADITGDVLGAFLPFNFVLDSDDLTSSKEIQKLFDEPIDSLETLVFAWQAQPADRKAMIWPSLVKEVKKATGTDVGGFNITDKNTLKAMAFLDLFMRPDAVEEATFTKRLDIALGVLDAVDFAPQAIMAILRASRQSIKSSNIAKIAKEVGNEELSSDITAASIIDDDIAEAANISKQDAINNSMPYVEPEELAPSKIDGLSGPVVDKLNNIARLNNNIETHFAEDSERLKIGITNKPEREYHVKRQLEKITEESEDYLTDQGFYIENLRSVDVSEDLTRISYDIRDGATGELHLKLNEDIRWGLDKVTGDFTETVEAGARPGASASRFLGSPSWWARTASSDKKVGSDFFESFKSASVLEDLTAADKQSLGDLLQESTKSVRGVTKAKARERVNQVLIQGDEQINEVTGVRGRVYSVQELREGIKMNGGGEVKLTSDDEIAAYYGANMVSKTLFNINNRVARRQLEAINAKQIAGVDGQHGIGRVFDTANAGQLSASTTSTRIWNRGSGEIINASPDAIQEAYTKGQKLVKLLEPEELPPNLRTSVGREFVDYVLVHTDDIADLPSVVLHKKDGYVPKINQNVEWLLKENVSIGVKNDRAYKNQVTLRFFSNEGDAVKARKAIIARQTAKINNNPEISPAQRSIQIKDLEARYEKVADREISPEQRLTESFGSSGGLYTGARSKSDIFYGLNDIEPERLGAFQALQRATAHTGAYATRNEWRLGEQQRWVNSVREVMGGSVDITDFQSTKLGITPREKALEEMRTRINLWSGMPTKEETVWKSFTQGVHDLALYGFRGAGYADKSSVKSLLWLKHADPFAAAKSAAFHTTLGMFNPVQVYVQSQAAVVSIARFPKEAPSAIKYATGMAYLDRMHNKQAFNTNLLKLRKDAPLLEEVHKQWLKSGLPQSVRTNADIVAMESGIGNSMDSFKRVMDAGMAPYRFGEMINRRISFSMSYLNWKKANPGKIANRDELVSIIGDSKMSMLELNRANAARFQGGPDANFMESVLGVMFQFGQVPMKTLELAVKGSARGGLKPGEKARILGVQAALFGLVGVPMGGAIFSGFEELTGVRRESMDPEVVAAWNGGMTQALLTNYLGADVEIASRASLSSGIQTFLADLANGNDGIGWKAAGAFGSVGQRVSDLVSQGIWPVLGAAYDDEPITKADWGVFAGNLGELLRQIPSSSRNLFVAQIMNDMNILYDKKGQVVVWKDFNPQTELFTALGFSPSERERIRQIQASNMDAAKVEQSYVNVYAAMLHRAVVTGRGDLPSRATYRLADRILSRAGLDEAAQVRIKQKVLKRLTDPETIRDREYKTWYNRLYVDPLTGMMIEMSPHSPLHTLKGGTPIIQPLGQQLERQTTGQEPLPIAEEQE